MQTPIGPFTKQQGALLRPRQDLWWATKDVFNPGAVVRDGKVHLLVRGEDNVGRFAGTSRVGLAIEGDDGFAVEPEPVIGPTLDLEEEGGCEDPRLVEAPDGSYVCTYTGFNGTRPVLLVATSPDLRTWTKHGPAFVDTPYANRSAKSGSIVTAVVDGRLVATKIDGRYWMYWGEGVTYIATSDDLIAWKPLEFEANTDRTLSFENGRWGIEWIPGTNVLLPILMPRAFRFDSGLTEPGPPAVLTDEGIVLIYNGANNAFRNDPTLPVRAYSPGVAVFDPLDPTVCISRPTEPLLKPSTDDERKGQVDNVCFAEGLVLVGDEWRLYFGMADSRIGCATAPVR